MVDKMATLIQILAKNAHQDKRPMNALLAHAVERCEQRGASFLIYGKFRYGNKQGDSLGEFKRRNGFEELKFPRYYVPLTMKGQIALKLGAHLGLANMIPRPATNLLLRGRGWALRLWSRPRGTVPIPAETTESN
jgi:hypothetical protein